MNNTELKLYLIQDSWGEAWWIAHFTGKGALDCLTTEYATEVEDAEVVEVEPDRVISVFLADGREEEEYPAEPVLEDGNWLVRAEASKFLAMAKLGDMIATTIY